MNVYKEKRIIKKKLNANAGENENFFRFLYDIEKVIN